jgi:hypothetical protein
MKVKFEQNFPSRNCAGHTEENSCRRAGELEWLNARGSILPFSRARKFALINDFMSLDALLRDFFRTQEKRRRSTFRPSFFALSAWRKMNSTIEKSLPHNSGFGN